MSEIKAGILLSLKDKFSQGITDAGGTVQKFASSAASAIQGIDKAFSGLGTAAGALGVSLSLGAATKEIINLDNRLTRIGLTASASAEQVNALKQKVFEAASDSSIKIDTTSINDALDVVMTKTGDLKYTEDNIRNIAIAIQATGEQGAAIGSVFSEFQKFGYTADQISKLMDDMVKQGDQGAFTFGEFAKAGSAVISAYSPIGTAPDDIKRANAAMQIIMMGTKSAEIAVTALGSAMSELSSPDKQQKLMAIGVRVRDEQGAFRDFNDIMRTCSKFLKRSGTRIFLETSSVKLPCKQSVHTLTFTMICTRVLWTWATRQARWNRSPRLWRERLPQTCNRFKRHLCDLPMQNLQNRWRN